MSDPLVTIKRYNKAIEANLAKGKLAAAGVPVFVIDDQQITVDSNLANAAGAVLIRVPSSYVNQANSILGISMELSVKADRSEVATCQACGSDRFTFKLKHQRILAQILAVYFALGTALSVLLGFAFSLSLLFLVSLAVFSVTAYVILGPRQMLCERCSVPTTTKA